MVIVLPVKPGVLCAMLPGHRICSFLPPISQRVIRFPRSPRLTPPIYLHCPPDGVGYNRGDHCHSSSRLPIYKPVITYLWSLWSLGWTHWVSTLPFHKEGGVVRAATHSLHDLAPMCTRCTLRKFCAVFFKHKIKVKTFKKKTITFFKLNLCINSKQFLSCIPALWWDFERKA